ncbi:MAG: hypothetical protein ACYTBZ_14285 [Planctomycetota bacterium]
MKCRIMRGDNVINYISLLCFCLAVLIPQTVYGSKGPWGAMVVGKQSESERLATIDLQRYLGQVTGATPQIMSIKQWHSNPRPALILGTPTGNLLIRDHMARMRGAGEQGYYLASDKMHNKRTVIAAGNSPAGAVNAVYGLLRELGYGFYLGSETIPDSLPAGIGDEPIVRQPALKIRGVLPWYNFLNSPTTWNPQDHRAFVDQLIRLGANFLGFHTYNSEPFGAYKENGRAIVGKRLLNTRSSLWSSRPTPTSQFAFGTDKLFADEYFGAASTQLDWDDHKVVFHEQDIMREALDYGSKRGLYTCLGFEIHGDPTDPKVRDVFLKRVNHVLNQHPSLDYLWIWQPETQGVQGFRQKYVQHILPTKFEPTSPLGRYGVARRKIFKRIVERSAGARPFFQDSEAGKIARAIEGARLEQFAQLAYRAMSRREQAPKLVISGWGGDERLLSAEYYDGLDKLLPGDVVFSSLDHVWSTRGRVDTIYHQLPAQRQRWPIPWLENDGDEWHPQPYVHPYQKMMKTVHQGGSQGILGIHWRTRELAENFSYIVDSAWNPNLTASQFFADLAQRCYGPAIAEEMAEIHTDLDKLGYRWVGGIGQAECGPFRWGPGLAGKAQSLSKLRDKIARLHNKATKGKEQLNWLINRIDWILSFREAELAAVKAKELLDKAHSAQPKQAKSLAAEALSLLDNGAMVRAIRSYAQRVSTRGEYGVLATINTKAVPAWRDLRNESVKILGRDEPGESKAWQPQAQIILPRFPGSVTENRNLEFLPLVLVGKPAWVHYRSIGTKVWTSRPMTKVRGWVKRAQIPASAVKQPGFEFGFSFKANSSEPMAFGPTAVTVFPKLKVKTKPLPTKPTGQPAKLTLTVKEGQTTPVELTWTDITDADYFKVYRDGQVIMETAVTFFPDTPVKTSVLYVVEAWRDGQAVVRSQPVQFTMSDRPITEKVILKTHTNQSAVVLYWPMTASSNIVKYKIYRKPFHKQAGTTKKLLAEVRALRSAENVFQDKPLAGRWEYAVVPVNAAGREGPTASAIVEYPPKSMAQAAINLPLNQRPKKGKVVGRVDFTNEGAAFTGGHIEMAHQPYMNLGRGMTMIFEFKADSTDGMPVLLCHGKYLVDGWFVQILGKKLIVRTPHGDARGPTIETGKRYAVRFVFDGRRPHLKVNGQWYDQAGTVLQPIPAKRKMVIGQYEKKSPQYAFKGSIRNLIIVTDALLDGVNNG